MKGKNVISMIVALMISLLVFANVAIAAVPVISAPTSQSVNEGQLLQFTVTATDSSGHTMTLSASNLPSGASFTQTSNIAGFASGQFSWVPNFAQSGTYSVSFTANDQLGNAASQVTTVTVNDVSTGSTSSSGIDIVSVKIDGDEISDSSTNFIRDVQRGDSFDVKVSLKSNSNKQDVQVSAQVRGYDNRQPIEDITNTFDMKSGVTYVKTLSLKLPDRVEQDRYKLRIQVEDRDSPTTEKTYELEIDTERHAVKIKDVVLNPDTEVVAGRALIAVARVQNMGEKTEKGIKIKVSVPELGISATDFIDELEKAGDNDDEATSEELFMRIPVNAKAGNYNVVTDVWFQDGDEHVSRTDSISVVSAEQAPAMEIGKVTVTYSVEKQDVIAGEAATLFPITFTNSGTTARVFIIEVETMDWGTAKVSPSNAVSVKPGETATAYVMVSANAGTASGERAVVVNVKDTSGESVKQISLRANVAAGNNQPIFGGSSRKVLEVGLIVLIVILAVIALVVAFQRLRGGKEEEDEGSQTYY